MKIEKAQSSDAGAYSCHASNGVGDELVAHFSLVVKGTLFLLALRKGCLYSHRLVLPATGSFLYQTHKMRRFWAEVLGPLCR